MMFQELAEMLEKSRSSARVADAMGWPRWWLSRYLNSRKVKPWWDKTKRRWREENAEERRKRRRQSVPVGGPPVARPFLEFDTVKQALQATESVNQAAALVGVKPNYLSQYLNRPTRRAWWEHTKAAWKKVRAARRKARYRVACRRRELREALRANPKVWEHLTEKALDLVGTGPW